jgi:hypothetical protein
MDYRNLRDESNEVFELIEANLSKATQHILSQTHGVEVLKTDIETYKLTALMNIATSLKEINEHLEIISKKN